MIVWIKEVQRKKVRALMLDVGAAGVVGAQGSDGAISYVDMASWKREGVT